ncbi:hypothetical protein TRICI_005817 [Trichomonascus ciferrii]|uniref:non-specific serine/threonine protein kinase n=1 Tax=Trichomonascus ciferrii TaxID=44093 RepID=A0A642UPT6_9ASCO|nr:hypothetical protein TRICI_005817 [Trichomonascus ciferrii]
MEENGQPQPSTPRKTRIGSQNVVSSTPSQRLSKHAVDPLSNYSLGDCLGKGAHASVFRGLNLATGETVAVKQIQLANMPKADLETIMLEIDLLKNLNHPNIVKYHGFVKTPDTLSIILE